MALKRDGLRQSARVRPTVWPVQHVPAFVVLALRRCSASLAQWEHHGSTSLSFSVLFLLCTPGTRHVGCDAGQCLRHDEVFPAVYVHAACCCDRVPLACGNVVPLWMPWYSTAVGRRCIRSESSLHRPDADAPVGHERRTIPSYQRCHRNVCFPATAS